jgi:hypothetical protein
LLLNREQLYAVPNSSDSEAKHSNLHEGLDKVYGMHEMIIVANRAPLLLLLFKSHQREMKIHTFD